MVAGSDRQQVQRFQAGEQMKLNGMKEAAASERVHAFGLRNFLARLQPKNRVESEFVGTDGELLKRRRGIGTGRQPVLLQKFQSRIFRLHNETIGWRPAVLPPRPAPSQRSRE